MRVYNTMTRQKEELVPLSPGEYKIYACGPTVYNLIHIGNARPICIFDVLRRYLEYKGNKVVFVQNFTDIDDKLIRRAAEENTTVKELSDRYIREYQTDAAGLGVPPATIHPRVDGPATSSPGVEVCSDMVTPVSPSVGCPWCGA